MPNKSPHPTLHLASSGVTIRRYCTPGKLLLIVSLLASIFLIQKLHENNTILLVLPDLYSGNGKVLDPQAKIPKYYSPAAPSKISGEAASNHFDLNQEDPLLIQYVRQEFLRPPLPKPYNLTDPFGDPTKNQPQYRTVLALLQEKMNGIFVEAGANDGEHLSNTLVLERDFGWTGLLVEPDTSAYEGLTHKNRKSWIANACLSTNKHITEVSFLEASASVLSKMADIGDWDKDWKDDEKKTVKKTCVPFYTLAAAINLTEIDYLSLDIEGAELQVLKTIPFSKIHIKVMTIEFNPKIWAPSHHEELMRLMYKNFFIFVGEIKAPYAQDFVFAHETIVREYCEANACGTAAMKQLNESSALKFILNR